jgi:hypothetical protein
MALLAARPDDGCEKIQQGGRMHTCHLDTPGEAADNESASALFSPTQCVCTDVIPMETQVNKTMRTVSELPSTLGWPAHVDILTVSPSSSNELLEALSPWPALVPRCQSTESLRAPQVSKLPVSSNGDLGGFRIRLPEAIRVSEAVERLRVPVAPLAVSLEGRVYECDLVVKSSVTNIVLASLPLSRP